MSCQSEESTGSYACGRTDLADRGGPVDACLATSSRLTEEHRDLAVNILPHRALSSGSYQDIMSANRVRSWPPTNGPGERDKVGTAFEACRHVSATCIQAEYIFWWLHSAASRPSCVPNQHDLGIVSVFSSEEYLRVLVW